MISKKQAVELAEKFIESELGKERWYQNIKEHVLAIILYGSVAKGNNRPDSDIDILFVLPLEIEKRYTIGEYFYSFEKEKINIVMRSIEKLRRIAEAKNDPFQQEVFRGAEIIWSKDGEMKNLLSEIKKISQPPKL
jgi:predicted nucleotidyltransferase